MFVEMLQKVPLDLIIMNQRKSYAIKADFSVCLPNIKCFIEVLMFKKYA